MTHTAFRTRLLKLAAAGVMIALLLRLAGGQRWFGIYGPALAVLAILPPLHRLLADRLAERGSRRRRALLVTLPLALLALVQLGYWTAFFHGPASAAVELGVVRFMIRDWLGPALPALGLALIGLIGLFIFRLSTQPAQEAGGE